MLDRASDLCSSDADPKADDALRTAGEDLASRLMSEARRELPERLRGIENAMVQLVIAHGLKRFNLWPLAEHFVDLAARLRRHLHEEENQLIKLVRQIVGGTTTAAEVKRLIPLTHEFAEEHKSIVGELEKLQFLTDDFAPPAEAGPLYRRMLAELAALSNDARRVCEEEDRTVFPRVRAFAETRAAIAAGSPP
jgi:iron-sulfur cluster repair protein YtfE (RIC family)